MNKPNLDQLKKITKLKSKIDTLKEGILEANFELEQTRAEIEKKLFVERDTVKQNKLIAKKKIERKKDLDQIRVQEEKIKETLEVKIDQILNNWLESNNINNFKNLIELDNLADSTKLDLKNNLSKHQSQTDLITVDDKVYDVNINNIKKTIKEELFKKMLRAS